MRILVLAAAVALLGSMLMFVGHSLRTMTASALRSVPLDWQGPVASYAQDRRAAAAVARQPGIAQASATATAPFAGASHTGPAGTTNAGSGSLLAVPPDYLSHIHTFRLLRGSLRPGAVVLDQQLAATLQARLGDFITLIPRPGARPQRYAVSGVGLITAPDTVFQPLNPQLGPAPAQPPSNAMIMPIDTFAATLGHALPSLPPVASAAAAIPGAQRTIQWQVQAQVDPGGLGGSPSQALTRAGQIVHRVERSLPGQVQFVDNLSDQLSTAASDALYAEVLYIMLAVPGALVALGLAYLAALGTVDRDRRDLALLRARGATRRQLLGLGVAESAALGLIAGAFGAGLAFAAVALIVKGTIDLTVLRAVATVAVCILLGVVGALAARVGAVASVLRGTVSEGRRSTRRVGKPLWQRLYLDILALALSGLIYWLTASTGFSAVVNPDSNPTLSLAVYMFFAPALLWLGATLLLIRLRGGVLANLMQRLAGARPRTQRRLLLVSAARRGAAINRGLLLVGLLLAFGVNLGIFTATYDQQANVDAELTLGGDVTVTAPPGVATSHRLESRIALLPGVQGTTAVDHSYAYVGPDLQDTFGIDTATIARGTTLRDSYFLGADARQTLARLASRPDGILVSRETIGDYQLKLGDLLRLRVLNNRTGHFHVVPFHVEGIVQEFPSAPRDSFMVANRSYLEAADLAGGPNVVFVKTNDPVGVSHHIAQVTRRDGTIIKNIDQQTQQTVSSITTVDLQGISRIEEVFTIVLAAAAMALFVALTAAERRHELATMAALGASLRNIGAFLWSEVALVLAAGLLLAAGLGLLLAVMLVAMLQHVFDPPPDSLAVPWAYLGELALGAAAAAGIAGAIATRRLRRLPLGRLLREQ
ncbi:MAG: FtsX-like permease family protein [Solirubrobacteraceae bacterium]